MIVAFTPPPSPIASPPIQVTKQDKLETLKTRQSPPPSKFKRKPFSPRLFSSIPILLFVGISLALFFYSKTNSRKTASEDKQPVANAKEAPGVQQVRKEQEKGRGLSLGFFQSKTPVVSSFTFFESVRVNAGFIHGFDIFLDVDNPRDQAIESMTLVLQYRTIGRTVPITKIQIGGDIRGGIEPKSQEEINLFVTKDKLGFTATQFKMQDNSILEVAIKEVRFVNGEILDLSERLKFKEGTQTLPDEDHIREERRKTDPSLGVIEAMDAFMSGELPKK